MAIGTAFDMVERIADEIGASAALRLTSFYGGTGRQVYVPVEPTPGHVIEKIIGPRAFDDLCKAFGGRSVPVPLLDLTPLRNAGRVWMLRDSSLSPGQMANLLGMSKQRISQILSQLRLEDFGSLAEALREEEEEGETA